MNSAKGYILYLVCMFMIVPHVNLYAQETDTLRAELQEIRIQVNRSGSPVSQTPFSITLWERSEAARLTTPATGMDQVLRSVPGVYIGNRENYSLGERLSIRGMGWRSAFGVRGVHVLLDGIPLTAPDGQTILEVVDPNLIRRAEVIRGPNAIFWGNGSGGTLYFETVDEAPEHLISYRGFAGSYNTIQSDLILISSIGESTNYRINLSVFETDGYRDYSSAGLNRIGLHTSTDLKYDRSIQYTGHFVSSGDIQNPGALTAAEADTSRRGANPMFVQRRAGKTYNHLMQGIRYTDKGYRDQIDAVVHGTWRQLENPIQNTIIHVDRLSAGARGSYRYDFGSFNLLAATDAAIQYDVRQNWVNQNGEKGNLTIDQEEIVRTLGIALIGEYRRGIWGLSSGLRLDLVGFKVSDRFVIADSGQEPRDGDRLLTALTPQIGFTVDISGATVFGGISTGFETPTTTELANNPDLSRGFNNDLKPETSVGIESGIRGYLPQKRLRYEVVLFSIDVRNGITSFQIQGQGDRAFYENQGRSRHNGAELAAAYQLRSNILLSANYMYSDFRIKSNQSGHRNNTIPGIPVHRGHAELVWDYRRAKSTLEVVHHGTMFADNGNLVQNDAFTVVNFRISGDFGVFDDRARFLPFIQIRNLTDAKYINSVTVNAFGGRYFEPAPGINFLAGVAFRI